MASSSLVWNGIEMTSSSVAQNDIQRYGSKCNPVVRLEIASND